MALLLRKESEVFVAHTRVANIKVQIKNSFGFIVQNCAKNFTSVDTREHLALSKDFFTDLVTSLLLLFN